MILSKNQKSAAMASAGRPGQPRSAKHSGVAAMKRAAKKRKMRKR